MLRRIGLKLLVVRPRLRPFKADRPRAIDEYIDYFGGGHGRRATSMPISAGRPALSAR